MKWTWIRRWLSRAIGLLAVLLVLAGIGLALFLKPYKDQAARMDLTVVSESPELPYERLPVHLIEAIVAAEDNRFFDHGGIDVKGICRATVVNLRTQSKAQGASTITQQLARQSFGILDKTMDRKLIEAFLALRIEKSFSKETILSKYLSRIYFGGGFYGIDNASVGYFDKVVDELSVGEAALLAGIIKAPSALEPIKHPGRAKAARDLVLQRMRALGYLTDTEMMQWRQSPLLPRH